MRCIASWARSEEGSALACTTDDATKIHGGMRPWIPNPWAQARDVSPSMIASDMRIASSEKGPNQSWTPSKRR